MVAIDGGGERGGESAPFAGRVGTSPGRDGGTHDQGAINPDFRDGYGIVGTRTADLDGAIGIGGGRRLREARVLEGADLLDLATACGRRGRQGVRLGIAPANFGSEGKACRRGAAQGHGLAVGESFVGAVFASQDVEIVGVAVAEPGMAHRGAGTPGGVVVDRPVLAVFEGGVGVEISACIGHAGRIVSRCIRVVALGKTPGAGRVLAHNVPGGIRLFEMICVLNVEAVGLHRSPVAGVAGRLALIRGAEVIHRRAVVNAGVVVLLVEVGTHVRRVAENAQIPVAVRVVSAVVAVTVAGVGGAPALADIIGGVLLHHGTRVVQEIHEVGLDRGSARYVGQRGARQVSRCRVGQGTGG